MLIMLSISGYGSSGPYAGAKVYDQAMQAMTAVGSVQALVTEREAADRAA